MHFAHLQMARHGHAGPPIQFCLNHHTTNSQSNSVRMVQLPGWGITSNVDTLDGTWLGVLKIPIHPIPGMSWSGNTTISSTSSMLEMHLVVLR